MKWILIIWVTGNQLAVPGYTETGCALAAKVARDRATVTAYCIPAPE